MSHILFVPNQNIHNQHFNMFSFFMNTIMYVADVPVFDRGQSHSFIYIDKV